MIEASAADFRSLQMVLQTDLAEAVSQDRLNAAFYSLPNENRRARLLFEFFKGSD
jgi:hypothetical protein